MPFLLRSFKDHGYTAPMINSDERNTLVAIHDLLIKAGMVKGGRQMPAHDLKIDSLAGDGSSRKFWRISEGKKNNSELEFLKTLSLGFKL